MKISKEKMAEIKIPEGMKEYLDMVPNGDEEEIFGQMLDDILYLSALIDLQHDFLRIVEFNYGVLPEGFSDFAESVKKLSDRTVDKWEDYAKPIVQNKQAKEW